MVSEILVGLEDSVRQFGEAWARGDVNTLDSLLSPTYAHTDAFGRLILRQQWLEYARQRVGRMTRIGFRDVEMRLVADGVAVVTGINDIEGPGVRNADDTNPLAIRFTQVWVQQKGRWLRENFQATPIRP